MTESTAWLEASDGQRWRIAGACSIGRAATNDVVIDDGKVSRRHALIHKQDDDEYWVIDLGSGNGTHLNGRRVTLATALKDRDTLTIGERMLAFRQRAGEAGRRGADRDAAQTIIQVRTLPCWLLVADIKGSTALAARLPTTELAMLVGRWLALCKEIIEVRGGQINKYLGDGFLAYWYFEPKSVTRIADAIERLVEAQRGGVGPPFRFALHKGPVTIGGGGAIGEDSLSGSDVIRVFRMEKLAGALGAETLVSEEARAALGDRLGLAASGTHVLDGFDGAERGFFAVAT